VKCSFNWPHFICSLKVYGVDLHSIVYCKRDLESEV